MQGTLCSCSDIWAAGGGTVLQSVDELCSCIKARPEFFLHHTSDLELDPQTGLARSLRSKITRFLKGFSTLLRPLGIRD